jgi:dehydrogenase/reductase SDR family protein 12
MTSEGVEETIATNLIFGCYLLVELALPILQTTQYSRVIVVSSAGMYTTKFPSWSKATSLEPSIYDGEEVYCYAKRAQVLLCEQWSLLFPTIRFVSCHPGWAATHFTTTAYKDVLSSMEPLRSPWQGAQVIAWLCVVPFIKLRRGAFYLDREKAPKHIIEGDLTRNSDEEVAEMMANLRLWSDASTRPGAATRRADGITDGFGQFPENKSKYHMWPSGPL